MATGGSTNGVLHLQSIAAELDMDLPPALFNRIGESTPFICGIAPNGPGMMQDLDEAGGITSVMKELEPLLDTGVLTVTGLPLSETLAEARGGDGEIIRSLDNPLAHEGGLMFLEGSLAPEGALVKKSAVPASMHRFRGPARIFATEDEANSTEIFGKASPAVVYVTTTTLARRSRYSLDVLEIPRGSGTGFVWDKSGLIVTNFHVIAGAQRLTVTLQDRSEYDAQVIGIAPEKDLAVLRILEPPEDLVTLPLGDSSELNVGRKVLAIGNPLGQGFSVSAGIISARNRSTRALRWMAASA